MIISYQWLLEYLPVSLSTEEISSILTGIGLEVEALEKAESIPGGLAGLVIGEVITCERHPNADKLSVTTVNTGGDALLNIVCGAPNVAAGQKVVVATVGTTVHPTTSEPFLIKKAKIRGADSEGMICAEDEIGLGDSHAGIMILPETAVPGTPAATYFNIPATDYSIHIGLTPNRSDANSHIGVARDVCAWLTHHRGEKYEVRMPVVSPQAGNGNSVAINIEASDACPRYTGISLKNVRVGESPEWIKNRLKAIGVRPINNVVDITNFVLHEYGQPLHAFDEDKLAGKQINIRCLPQGTAFMALDGKERKLQAHDLVICDADGPVAIGGVFGGLNSGITETTTNVFLESAYFMPLYVRRTSMHHGLRTDAALHFEKGVDINNVVPASQRAAQLIVELAGAEIDGGMMDVYPTAIEAVQVTVSYQYINMLSGKQYRQLAVNELLLAMGFEIISQTNEQLTVKVPSNKPDVTQPADIVEEVLRMDGLDNIQLSGRISIALTGNMGGDHGVREQLSNLMCGMGLQELVTNSIVNSKYYPGQEDLVQMVNSLSSGLDVMRPSMLESGLEVIMYNCNRKNTDLALFEFGNTYLKNGDKYNQQANLAIWITGNITTQQWNQKPLKADAFYLKGIVNTLLAYGNIRNAREVNDNENDLAAVWTWNNQELCTVEKVTPAKLKEFDIKQDVYYACINWQTWLSAREAGKTKYKEVAKFPAVSRDLALVLDSTTSYSQIKTVTEQLKMKELQSYNLFDVYENEKLGAGKKSMAMNYIFQLQDRTLTDAETEALMKKLVDTYAAKLNAQIR